MLFSSGSEKAPKAVPLTHANVLGDLRGALPLLGLDRTHSGLVFLPLFHSFGHTVTGLLPLLAGVKAVYHPDPTDAGALVRKAALPGIISSVIISESGAVFAICRSSRFPAMASAMSFSVER